MKRIQRDQAPQKSKIDQPAVTGIPIQRKLPDQKSGALPANDVRVCYQPTPVSPTGGGVVQCEGLGSLFCCGCDDVTDTEQQRQPPPPPSRPRNDGDCAVHALFWLKWEPGYTKAKGLAMNRIQNAQFGALGTIIKNENELKALLGMKVMVEFFRNTEQVAFHVMYTDGMYLRGINNDPTTLSSLLSAPVAPSGDVEDVKDDNWAFKTDRKIKGEGVFNIEKLTVNPNDLIYIKYVTQDEYLSLYPPCC